MLYNMFMYSGCLWLVWGSEGDTCTWKCRIKKPGWNKRVCIEYIPRTQLFLVYTLTPPPHFGKVVVNVLDYFFAHILFSAPTCVDFWFFIQQALKICYGGGSTFTACLLHWSWAAQKKKKDSYFIQWGSLMILLSEKSKSSMQFCLPISNIS